MLVYPSRPQSEADRRAREVVLVDVKQAKPKTLQRVGTRLAEMESVSPVRALIPADAVLVPAPRSVPLANGALWSPRAIAEAMVVEGVGKRVAPILTRLEPVRRSTGARTAAEREPPLRHFETLGLAGELWSVEDAEHIVVVDDVVTTGSTLIACASKLAAAGVAARITAFAVARADRHTTLSIPKDLYAPIVETIVLVADEGRPRRG